MAKINDVYSGAAVDMEELGMINGRMKIQRAVKRQRKIEERRNKKRSKKFPDADSFFNEMYGEDDFYCA